MSLVIPCDARSRAHGTKAREAGKARWRTEPSVDAPRFDATSPFSHAPGLEAPRFDALHCDATSPISCAPRLDAPRLGFATPPVEFVCLSDQVYKITT